MELIRKNRRICFGKTNKIDTDFTAEDVAALHEFCEAAHRRGNGQPFLNFFGQVPEMSTPTVPPVPVVEETEPATVNETTIQDGNDTEQTEEPSGDQSETTSNKKAKR